VRLISSGGELLVQLAESGITGQTRVYVSIRNKDLHQSAKQLGAEPVDVDLSDSDAITRFVVDHQGELVQGKMARLTHSQGLRGACRFKKHADCLAGDRWVGTG
jgi:hypothetical protein